MGANLGWFCDVLMRIVDYVASYANTQVGMEKVDREDIRKGIGYTACGISFIYTACVEIPGFLTYILDVLSKKWWILFAFIFILAVSPPIVAWREKRKTGQHVTDKYIISNFSYNVIGAGAASGMLAIAHNEIMDFRFIEDFYVAEIVPISLTLSISIAFAYQSLEQNSELKDHDASLKWKNQILNVLHLCNVYFWSMISVIFVVAYNLYCYIHHMPLEFNIFYLLFLFLSLLFFYSCGFNKVRHVYLIFVTYVPAILTCSVFWMSWFSASVTMQAVQGIFIGICVVVYIALIYIHEKIIVKVKPGEEKEYAEYRRLLPLLEDVRCRGILYPVLLLAIIVVYATLWVSSCVVERISFDEAENYLSAICTDTEKDADVLFEEIITSEWADAEADNGMGDMDQIRYLQFLTVHLREEMIEKRIITEKSDFLSYDELRSWYVSQ